MEWLSSLWFDYLLDIYLISVRWKKRTDCCWNGWPHSFAFITGHITSVENKRLAWRPLLSKFYWNYVCKFWALIKTRKPSKPNVSRQFWTPSQPSQFPQTTCSWKMVGTKTPWGGQIWLWNQISRQICVVIHIIGVWHTYIARINEPAFDIEALIPLFLSSCLLGHNHPPIWDLIPVYFFGHSFTIAHKRADRHTRLVSINWKNKFLFD